MFIHVEERDDQRDNGCQYRLTQEPGIQQFTWVKRYGGKNVSNKPFIILKYLSTSDMRNVLTTCQFLHKLAIDYLFPDV